MILVKFTFVIVVLLILESVIPQGNIISNYQADFQLPSGATSQYNEIDYFVTDASPSFTINAGVCQVGFEGQPEKLEFVLKMRIRSGFHSTATSECMLCH